MIKVEHTKTHNIPIELTPTIHGLIATRDKKQVLVTDAELVLVECLNSQKALFFRFVNDDVIHLKTDTLILTKPIFYLIPILISRTEKIEEGDWMYCKDLDGKFYIKQCTSIKATAAKEHYYTANADEGGFGIAFKILALPEHFSPQQLQDIVDGKLKEGKCLVECEYRVKSGTIEEHEKGLAGYEYGEIKLNPLTIYPVVMDLKFYENNAKNDFVSTPISVLRYISELEKTIKSIGFDEYYWFEQNVK